MVSFSPSLVLTLQLRFVVTLADASENAKTFQYFIVKLKSVEMSAIIAKLFCALYAFDPARIFCVCSNDVFEKIFPNVSHPQLALILHYSVWLQ